MRIAVVGGGAAGFFGAISAVTHNPSSEITLFEAAGQPLRKVKTVARERRQKDRRSAGRERRHVEMFAGRDDYSMTEEEVADYENKIRDAEKEEERKRAEARKSLGEPQK